MGIGLVVLASFGFGCASQPEHAVQSDRRHALESALRFEFDRWDKYFSSSGIDGVTEYIIQDAEFASWLVRQFQGHKPPVVNYDDVYRSGPPLTNCMLWSAKIQIIGNDHATVYVTFYEFPESGGGYIVQLHSEKGLWLVDSDKWSQTGS